MRMKKLVSCAPILGHSLYNFKQSVLHITAKAQLYYWFVSVTDEYSANAQLMLEYGYCECYHALKVGSNN